MIVFRIETEDGGGMYQGALAPLSYPCCPLRRHAPRMDPRLPARLTPWRFGFQTLRHLIEWVANETWLDNLAARGFRIAVYRTEAYVVGSLQCVFQTATLVSHLSLDTVRREVAEEAFDEVYA